MCLRDNKQNMNIYKKYENEYLETNILFKPIFSICFIEIKKCSLYEKINICRF